MNRTKTVTPVCERRPLLARRSPPIHRQALFAPSTSVTCQTDDTLLDREERLVVLLLLLLLLLLSTSAAERVVCTVAWALESVSWIWVCNREVDAVGGGR